MSAAIQAECKMRTFYSDLTETYIMNVTIAMCFYIFHVIQVSIRT